MMRLWVILRVVLGVGLRADYRPRDSKKWFLLALFYPWRFARHQPRAVALRLALEKLGPIFVKLGQALSTRRDLLPLDVADELAKLQDRVPAFPVEQAIAQIEKDFGKPLEQLFQTFDREPLAAASIAQVHAATLLNGDHVVVKVLRPDIKRQIERDVAVMHRFARWFQRLSKRAQRLRPQEVVAEFEQTILDELNLRREAANASQLRRNFLESTMMRVPAIYWDYVSERVMVQQRVFAVPIGNKEELKARQVDFKKLAEHGVEIFFTQVFRDCFFHADMHPGNLFVDCTDPKNPVYVGVDFGIMGSLNPVDQDYLARNFLAFFQRDYREIARLHIESGWVPADTRLDQFESAIRTVAEPICEKPLAEISFATMLIALFRTAERFNMTVQPQLLLLQKTLFNIEGLGRELYPQLDLWQTAKPFLEQWMQEQRSPRRLLKKLLEKLCELSSSL